MNKIYKVIYSKVRNCYVVVSELAKNNGKGTSRGAVVGS
ncbi:ESPR domain-containing protein, partial [Acidaminococcus timonensis]